MHPTVLAQDGAGVLHRRCVAVQVAVTVAVNPDQHLAGASVWRGKGQVNAYDDRVTLRDVPEKSHTYYVLAGNTPVLVHNCVGALQSASDAANTAAENPASIFVKDKHLSTFRGNYAKFATADKAVAQSWVAEALKSDGAVFRTNGLDGTFKVETDMGRVVGTKGQTGIRAVVTDDGRVINAFPFNVGP